MLQSEPVKKLQAFAENNKETQGKFTIGDEKVEDSIQFNRCWFADKIRSNITFS